MDKPSKPVAWAEGLRAIIIATAAVLSDFAVWHPSQQQLGSLLALYASVSILLSSIVHSKVTPVAGLKERLVALTEQAAAFVPVARGIIPAQAPEAFVLPAEPVVAPVEVPIAPPEPPVA